MRVDDNRPVAGVQPPGVAGRAQKKAGPRKAEPSGDSVAISGRARDVQKAKELLARLPEVREERVAEVRARLARGDYNVPSGEVAEEMLRALPEGQPVE